MHGDWEVAAMVGDNMYSGSYSAASSVLVSSRAVNSLPLAYVRPERHSFTFRVTACSDASLHFLRRPGDMQVCWPDFI